MQYEGEIWLFSELEKGSNFTFKIKLIKESEEINKNKSGNVNINRFKFEWKPHNSIEKIKYINDFDVYVSENSFSSLDCASIKLSETSVKPEMKASNVHSLRNYFSSNS